MPLLRHNKKKGLEYNSALASSKLVDHPAAPGTTSSLPAGDTHAAYTALTGLSRLVPAPSFDDWFDEHARKRALC